VEDRDRLGQGQGQVEEQRALPGLLDGFGAEFALALGGGVRLGCQELRVDVSGFPPVIRVPAELGAIRGLALAEQQVIRLTLDPLAGLEAEGLRAGTPPLSGRLPSLSNSRET
jgi:hypothetical protein